MDESFMAAGRNIDEVGRALSLAKGNRKARVMELHGLAPSHPSLGLARPPKCNLSTTGAAGGS